eukprot:1093564-Prorocentrum_minimum.AAC.1
MPRQLSSALLASGTLLSNIASYRFYAISYVHVVTVGVRGTVPLANRADELSCLGITTRKEQLP